MVVELLFFGSYSRKIIKITLSKWLSFLGDFNSVSRFLDVLPIVSASASLNFSGFYPKTSRPLIAWPSSILSAGLDLTPDFALTPCFCVSLDLGLYPLYSLPSFLTFALSHQYTEVNVRGLRGREAHTEGRLPGISERVKRWELANVNWRDYSVSSMFQRLYSVLINLIPVQHYEVCFIIIPIFR